MTCPNCGDRGPHFVPPSLGEPGFFTCQEQHRPVMIVADHRPSVMHAALAMAVLAMAEPLDLLPINQSAGTGQKYRDAGLPAEPHPQMPEIPRADTEAAARLREQRRQRKAAAWAKRQPRSL